MKFTESPVNGRGGRVQREMAPVLPGVVMSAQFHTYRPPPLAGLGPHHRTASLGQSRLTPVSLARPWWPWWLM